MKLTIDTIKKTIQLYDEIETSELNKIIEQFNLNEYELIKNYTYTIPRTNKIPNWDKSTTFPYHDGFKSNITSIGKDTYKSEGFWYETNSNGKNSKKILLKG